VLHVLGLVEHAIGNDLRGDSIGGTGVDLGIQEIQHQRQHLARLGCSLHGFDDGPIARGGCAERFGRRFDHLDSLDIYALAFTT